MSANIERRIKFLSGRMKEGDKKISLSFYARTLYASPLLFIILNKIRNFHGIRPFYGLGLQRQYPK